MLHPCTKKRIQDSTYSSYFTFLKLTLAAVVIVSKWTVNDGTGCRINVST